MQSSSGESDHPPQKKEDTTEGREVEVIFESHPKTLKQSDTDFDEKCYFPFGSVL